MTDETGYQTLTDRLRDELSAAEVQLHEVTDPQAKQEALDRFEQALSRFTRVVLNGEVPEPY